MYAFGFTAAFTISAGIPGAMGWLTDTYGSGRAFYPVLITMLFPMAILPILKMVKSNYRSPASTGLGG